jgi:transposase
MRTRYQMLLFSAKGHTSTQIAELVLRSQDTVVRVLKRFLSGGLEAVPRRTASGRERTITSAWESELLRVIELDPHEVGQDTAHWTTQLLATYLSEQTGVSVSQETVRVYLHAHSYGGLASDLDAQAQSRRESGLRGKRLRVEVLLAGAQVPAAPETLPCHEPF